MENQNMEQEVQQQGAGTEQPNTGNQQQGNTRLFTQDEVNEIVQHRLARAKGDAGAASSAREQELNRRELQLDARERLADAGISKDYLPLVNCSSKEEMENSIKLIATLTGQQEKKNSGYRVVMNPEKPGFHSTGKQQHFPNGDPDIRAAMGLKG